MAVADPVVITTAYQTEQARRAAIVALLVTQWYRTRVNVEDPNSVKQWLDLLVPKILSGRRLSASLASQYANVIRAIELPRATDGFSFAPGGLIDENAIRASLSVVGVTEHLNRVNKIRALPDSTTPPLTKQALIDESSTTAQKAVIGATVRHVLNGGRNTIKDGVAADPKTLGYVRVTKDKPCYFCAMLASRGRVYDDDSFDMSDPRFEGPGDAKVHDHCACGLKPIYREDDEFLAKVQPFTDLWNSLPHKSGKAAILQFRQAYEGRAD